MQNGGNLGKPVLAKHVRTIARAGRKMAILLANPRLDAREKNIRFKDGETEISGRSQDRHVWFENGALGNLDYRTVHFPETTYPLSVFLGLYKKLANLEEIEFIDDSLAVVWLGQQPNLGELGHGEHDLFAEHTPADVRASGKSKVYHGITY